MKATVADIPGNPEIAYPFRIPPIRGLQYFEMRQGFNILKWLKTPYGLMMAFAAVSLILLPMMKMDPEEYKEMMKAKEEEQARKKQ